MTPVAWPAAVACGLCSCGYNVVMTPVAWPAVVACFLCLRGYNDVMTRVAWPALWCVASHSSPRFPAPSSALGHLPPLSGTSLHFPAPSSKVFH